MSGAKKETTAAEALGAVLQARFLDTAKSIAELHITAGEAAMMELQAKLEEKISKGGAKK